MGHNQSLPTVDFDQETYFTNTDGKRIVCKYWTPETPTEKPSALVFIAHGAAEVCHTYGCVAEPLTKHNIVVFSHDHVGHGKSDGERVHCTDLAQYTQDIFQHVEMMKEKYGADIPVFIMGHSMGGTLAVKACMDKPDLFRGMVLVAAGIHENPETATPFKVRVAKVTASVYPQLQVGKIESEWCSRDPAVQKEFEDNPWCWHGGMKAKWGVSMLNVMKHIQNNPESITVPFLALHGDADKLCMLSGSQMLAEKAGSADKKLKVYPGGYHELHREPDGMGQEVIADLVDWIVERM